MAIKPKFLDSEGFFASASLEVKPGYYKKYVNDYPAFLRECDSQREPNAYKCKMVVATMWQGGKFEDISLNGVTYFVFTFEDHAHIDGVPHFNKMVQGFSHDEAGRGFRFTMDKDIDDHIINAVATGTSLAYLKLVYGIPEEESGPIADLIAAGTSIDPYPKE